MEDGDHGDSMSSMKESAASRCMSSGINYEGVGILPLHVLRYMKESAASRCMSSGI